LDVIVYIDIIDQDALYIYNPRMQDTMRVHVKQKISLKIDTNENKCNHSNNIFLMELFQEWICYIKRERTDQC